MKKINKKRKNLTTQWSNLYIALSLFFAIGFGFFLTSKVFMADDLDILNTEVGKEYNLNANGKFTIKDWVYDEENNKMQVTLITSNMRNHLAELNFKAISRVNLQHELPTEVVYSSNDIYIINIDNIPKEFQQVSLRLVRKDISISEEFDLENNEELSFNTKNEKLITSIYADQRVVKKGEIKDAKVKEYAIKITDEMINDSENEIAALNKNIEAHDSMIEHINNEISILRSELVYQTLEEQTESNNKIYNLENEIQSTEREIETLQLDIQSHEAKIERLEQRKRDLQF